MRRNILLSYEIRDMKMFLKNADVKNKPNSNYEMMPIGTTQSSNNDWVANGGYSTIKDTCNNTNIVSYLSEGNVVNHSEQIAVDNTPNVVAYESKCGSSNAAGFQEENISNVVPDTIYDSNQQKKAMNNKIQIVNFNASWCGHSKALAPTWKNIMAKYKNHSKIEVLDLKCEGENENICRDVGIKGYPTIIAILENGYNKEYTGDRSEKDIIRFIESL